MVEEMLASRGIELSHETVRRWVNKFGQAIARRIRETRLCRGDTWHLDEIIVKISGRKHWLWRAVDQHGQRPTWVMLVWPSLGAGDLEIMTDVLAQGFAGVFLR